MRRLRAIGVWVGGLAGLLAAGCRVAPAQQAAHKEAARANAVSNKHTLTESPTLERAAPRPQPPPGP